MKTFADVIQYAIRHEEKEASFYERLAERSKSKDQKAALMVHAEEERDHKRRLESALAGGKLPMGRRSHPDSDLKYAELLVIDESGYGAVGYEEALLHAAKREKAAQKFYEGMAAEVSDAGLKEIFTFLAEQEGKHRNRLEQEYDDVQVEG